jgi:ferredoxin-NADP reductase
VARAAVLGRLTWRVARLVDVHDETPTARTLVLEVPGWPGHLPGQHVDVRLTAPDGYSTQRSYSIASAPDGSRVELTVQVVEDGEVSPYLVEVLGRGDPLELRGPIGGYFTWSPDERSPTLLVAGGSGVVPLMAIARTRAATGTSAPMRLVASTRSPSTLLYAAELARLAAAGDGFRLDLVYTREAPAGSPVPPGRLDHDRLATLAPPAQDRPLCFVCGPTGFVETVADLLVALGNEPGRVRTERFGPTGGKG